MHHHYSLLWCQIKEFRPQDLSSITTYPYDDLQRHYVEFVYNSDMLMRNRAEFIYIKLAKKIKINE